MGELQISPLRSPGFPVESGLIGAVRAPLFTESRMRGRCQQHSGRKSGYASVEMTKGTDAVDRNFRYMNRERQIGQGMGDFF